MGVPTSEVGYTSATTGRGEHEVHKGHVVALEKKKINTTGHIVVHFSPVCSVTLKYFPNYKEGKICGSPIRDQTVQRTIFEQLYLYATYFCLGCVGFEPLFGDGSSE
jgi:hypothetical protein